jgi:uncharacterized DUF497 family protein
MKIMWDEPKRVANFQEHGLDFADVVFFDWAGAVIETTHSHRMKAVGHFEDGTFATLGTEAMSIISFRPASERERKVLR